MSRVVNVIATQPQIVHGREVAVGEIFRVSPIEAASLLYRKLALLDPTGLSTPTRRRRGTYRRRDLRAEEP